MVSGRGCGMGWGVSDGLGQTLLNQAREGVDNRRGVVELLGGLDAGGGDHLLTVLCYNGVFVEVVNMLAHLGEGGEYWSRRRTRRH